MISAGIDYRLCKEYILSKTTEELIARYYLGVSQIPCRICNPTREDRKPSLGLYYSNWGVSYIDFKTNDRGDIYHLLSEMFNLNELEVYQMILDNLSDIGYGTSNQIKLNYKNRSSNQNNYRNNKPKIKVRIRKWQQYDFDFWNQYGIDKLALKFGNIYPITSIFLTTAQGKKHILPAEKYSYAYVEEKDDIQTYKIYQPYSENYKWINNHDASVWDLWNKLPEIGDKVIITSSRKDALTLWRNLNIPSVSLQGEGYIPKKSVVYELKKRFNHVYCLYDNDEAGNNFSNLLCEQFDLIQLIIPNMYNAKDPSDLFKLVGKEEFIKILKKLIDETTIRNFEYPF